MGRGIGRIAGTQKRAAVFLDSWHVGSARRLTMEGARPPRSTRVSVDSGVNERAHLAFEDPTPSILVFLLRGVRAEAFPFRDERGGVLGGLDDVPRVVVSVRASPSVFEPELLEHLFVVVRQALLARAGLDVAELGALSLIHGER